MKKYEVDIQNLSKDYYNNPLIDNDFIQIAIDVYGNAIRDNTKQDLIEIGKQYHLTGEE